MALKYKLVGYDRQTEALAETHEIPLSRVKRAKKIAGIAGRPEIIGDWELSAEQAAVIANLIAADANLARCDWFLEPYQDAAADR